jgi:hypothetical protein
MHASSIYLAMHGPQSDQLWSQSKFDGLFFESGGWRFLGQQRSQQDRASRPEHDHAAAPASRHRNFAHPSPRRHSVVTRHTTPVLSTGYSILLQRRELFLLAQPANNPIHYNVRVVFLTRSPAPGTQE